MQNGAVYGCLYNRKSSRLLSAINYDYYTASLLTWFKKMLRRWQGHSFKEYTEDLGTYQ